MERQICKYLKKKKDCFDNCHFANRSAIIAFFLPTQAEKPPTLNTASGSVAATFSVSIKPLGESRPSWDPKAPVHADGKVCFSADVEGLSHHDLGCEHCL